MTDINQPKSQENKLQNLSSDVNPSILRFIPNRASGSLDINQPKQNKVEDIKEVQRMLLKKDYSVKFVKDLGEWMLKNIETSREYINKPEFKDFLNNLNKKQ